MCLGNYTANVGVLQELMCGLTIISLSQGAQSPGKAELKARAKLNVAEAEISHWDQGIF